MVEKICSYKKPRLMWMVLLVLFGTSIVGGQKPKVILSLQDKRALISEIKAAERSLSNLKVESQVWVEEKSSTSSLSDPCEPWKRTPICALTTAWFDGRPKGKARVDVHLQVSEWREGAAPYMEESYSLGFDGHYGRIAEHSTGHSGKTYSSRRGEILPSVPRQLKLKYLDSCTGRQFSSVFFFGEEGFTFSQFAEAAISPAALEAKTFEFTLEELQGVECVKLGSGHQKWGHISYWLDPARGFALLGHDNISIREDGSERVSTRIRVTKLKEVDPNIWWPMEAYVESDWHKHGEPYKRTVYRALNVVANDPNFDEGIFTVPFPDGYLIDDKVVGRKYRVGEDPNASRNQSEK